MSRCARCRPRRDQQAVEPTTVRNPPAPLVPHRFVQVDFMLQALQSADAGVQEGVLTMAYKLTEDACDQVAAPLTTDSPTTLADALMPHIAALFSSSSSADVRYQALRAFNMLATIMPAWLQANVNGYVAGLLGLGQQERDARILKARTPALSCRRLPCAALYSNHVHAQRVRVAAVTGLAG
jgi:hypothetical protein